MVFIETLGWVPIRPLQYGDTIRYTEAKRTPGLMAQLFSQTLVGFDITPEDVRDMRPEIPSHIERAILEASELLDDDDGEEEDAPGDDIEYREDSVFGDPTDTSDDITQDDVVFWLHERGYTFGEVYQLLLPEIDQLKEGFSRYQDRRETEEVGSSDTTAHGNRGDRAAQFGWR